VAAKRAKAPPVSSEPMQHREAAHYILNQVRACVDNVGDGEVERFLAVA
jgi:hypothetical protein